MRQSEFCRAQQQQKNLIVQDETFGIFRHCLCRGSHLQWNPTRSTKVA